MQIKHSTHGHKNSLSQEGWICNEAHVQETFITILKQFIITFTEITHYLFMSIIIILCKLINIITRPCLYYIWRQRKKIPLRKLRRMHKSKIRHYIKIIGSKTDQQVNHARRTQSFIHSEKDGNVLERILSSLLMAAPTATPIILNTGIHEPSIMTYNGKQVLEGNFLLLLTDF